MSEFRNLEHTYTLPAENEEWTTINIGKRVRRGEDREDTRSDGRAGWVFAPSGASKPTGKVDRAIHYGHEHAHADDRKGSEQIDPILP
jgi:hypothetical protein